MMSVLTAYVVVPLVAFVIGFIVGWLSRQTAIKELKQWRDELTKRLGRLGEP